MRAFDSPTLMIIALSIVSFLIVTILVGRAVPKGGEWVCIVLALTCTVTLKLNGIIPWGWFWVLFPLWVLVPFLLLGLLMAVLDR